MKIPFFDYNLPLQAYRHEDGTFQIVNYMARKNSCCELTQDECELEGQSEKDFFYRTALQLMNLAMLMVKFANKEIDSVYYSDENMQDQLPPSPYKHLVENMSWSLYKPPQAKEEPVQKNPVDLNGGGRYG